MADVLQWSGTLYTVNPDMSLSPPLVIFLSTVALLCAQAEVMVDIFYFDQVNFHTVTPNGSYSASIFD